MIAEIYPIKEPCNMIDSEPLQLQLQKIIFPDMGFIQEYTYQSNFLL